MALKALDIFKLTPKKNCKDCGFPTCMAFSMKVASGAVEVSKCPHMSDDAIAKLSEATAPLMRALKVGSGTSEYELGAETVLFRHEKTLVNRNRYAVAFDDSMTNEQIDFKIANIKAVNYIRIGEEMKAEMIVLEYRDNKEGFLNLVNRVNESGLDVTHIIVCEDVDISKEAIEILKDKKPVVYGANKENYKGMVESGETYNEDAVQMNEMMQDLQSVAENLRRAANEISEAADGVSNAVNQSAAGVSNAAEYTSELAGHMTGINESVEKNVNIAESLKNEVAGFQCE